MLQALCSNNEPYVDHGIEVLYRFANFDPFNPRCRYFGRNFDLGQVRSTSFSGAMSWRLTSQCLPISFPQFERFRRIMHTTPYAVLLGHESATILSALEVSGSWQ